MSSSSRRRARKSCCRACQETPHIRARDNPFAVHRIETIRYRPRSLTWNELFDRFAALRFRAAIVGPHGRGKTTLLEDLGRRLERQGFTLRRITLHEGDRRLTREQSDVLNGLMPREVLCLDGAEQLGPLAWRRVERRSRAAAGLVVTSHRPGLLPTLVECETSPELLSEILRELLGTGNR